MQAKGFSPVCTLTCAFKFASSLNTFPQLGKEQIKGRSPLYIIRHESANEFSILTILDKTYHILYKKIFYFQYVPLYDFQVRYYPKIASDICCRLNLALTIKCPSHDHLSKISIYYDFVDFFWN